MSNHTAKEFVLEVMIGALPQAVLTAARNAVKTREALKSVEFSMSIDHCVELDTSSAVVELNKKIKSQSAMCAHAERALIEALKA
jgi:hypothetical protein